MAGKKTAKAGYSIAKLKTFNGMEGGGYECVILLDGVEIGWACDDATGGPLNYGFHKYGKMPDKKESEAREKAFAEWALKQPWFADDEEWQKLTKDDTPAQKAHSAIEAAIHHIVQDLEMEKRVKRWCKGKTVFKVKGDQRDEFRTLKAPFDQRVKAHLITKYGDQLEYICNEKYGIV